MRKDIETANQFLRIPKRRRAEALIGRYMHLYALVEYSLNRLLAGLIGTSIVSWTVVTRNMGFSEKLDSIRAMYSIMDETGGFNEVYKQLMNLAKERNIIAHSIFLPSTESNGVTVCYFKASNKLIAVKDDYSVERMLERYSELRAVANSLNSFFGYAKVYRVAAGLSSSKRQSDAVTSEEEAEEIMMAALEEDTFNH